MFETATSRLALRHPRNLASLIEMYEGNYVRLMRLVPELERMQGTVVSRVAGALDLYLTVDERFRYTTTIILSYRFDDEDEGVVSEPNARLRVYHDARAVEVVGHRRRIPEARRRGWRGARMPEVYRKWELNRFLHKWLAFCGRQGHLFLGCTATPVEPLPAESFRADRPST